MTPPRLLTRVVALVLVPCLVVDPTFAKATVGEPAFAILLRQGFGGQEASAGKPVLASAGSMFAGSKFESSKFRVHEPGTLEPGTWNRFAELALSEIEGQALAGQALSFLKTLLTPDPKIQAYQSAALAMIPGTPAAKLYDWANDHPPAWWLRPFLRRWLKNFATDWLAPWGERHHVLKLVGAVGYALHQYRLINVPYDTSLEELLRWIPGAETALNAFLRLHSLVLKNGRWQKPDPVSIGELREAYRQMLVAVVMTLSQAFLVNPTDMSRRMAIKLVWAAFRSHQLYNRAARRDGKAVAMAGLSVSRSRLEQAAWVAGLKPPDQEKRRTLLRWQGGNDLTVERDDLEVKHPKFGAGRLMKVRLEGDVEKIEVAFPGYGKTTLTLQHALTQVSIRQNPNGSSPKPRASRREPSRYGPSPEYRQESKTERLGKILTVLKTVRGLTNSKALAARVGVDGTTLKKARDWHARQEQPVVPRAQLSPGPLAMIPGTRAHFGFDPTLMWKPFLVGLASGGVGWFTAPSLIGWFIAGGLAGAWFIWPHWFMLRHDDPQDHQAIPQGFSFVGPWSAKLRQALREAVGRARIRGGRWVLGAA